MSKRYRNRTGLGIIAFVVLILCGIVTYKRIDLREQSDNAKLQIDNLNKRIEEQKDRSVDISNLRAYVQTKKYIEERARKELGLVYEDEIIFKRDE